MYKITYNDNTTFIGGPPENSQWNLINKSIKSLYYILYGKKIYLEGFSNYNHLVYKANILNSNNNVKIFKLEIIATHPNYNIIITWDVKNSRFTITKQNPDAVITGISGWKIGKQKIFPILKTN